MLSLLQELVAGFNWKTYKTKHFKNCKALNSNITWKRYVGYWNEESGNLKFWFESTLVKYLSKFETVGEGGDQTHRLQTEKGRVRVKDSDSQRPKVPGPVSQHVVSVEELQPGVGEPKLNCLSKPDP